KTPQSLILCPTRELAQQVTKEIRRLGRKLVGLQVILLAGGQPAREQAYSLLKGVHIAVGTPGRVLDLIYKKKFFLDNIKTFVLDEADKMLELGFLPDIEAIISELPLKKQTVLFSATYPEAILNMSTQFQNNPQKVIIDDSQEDLKLIDQIYYEYEPDDKKNTLIRVLQQHNKPSILIFCNQKVIVDDLVASLQSQGASCLALHGNFSQNDRDRIMSLFRNGSCRILIATDVAARGLDIENLEVIINYDFPLQFEDYVHRIGRTGRAGKSGTAITLCLANQEKDLLDFANQLKSQINRPSLGYKNQHALTAHSFQAEMKTLQIDAGRKNKLRPGDILGALTGPQVNIPGTSIGKIQIFDHVSYVAIEPTQANVALKKLKDTKIKAQKFYIKLI
ncbi:MAG: DEAD/DEAH box helicase, partial [Bdellovibrionales bacterium]|nr:DEAD/DEAH box helicase [Bdellovibrionales bacterium]